MVIIYPVRYNIVASLECRPNCYLKLSLMIDNNHAENYKWHVLICDREIGSKETRKYLCLHVSQAEGVIEMEISWVILYNEYKNTVARQREVLSYIKLVKNWWLNFSGRGSNFFSHKQHKCVIAIHKTTWIKFSLLLLFPGNCIWLLCHSYCKSRPREYHRYYYI